MTSAYELYLFKYVQAVARWICFARVFVFFGVCLCSVWIFIKNFCVFSVIFRAVNWFLVVFSCWQGDFYGFFRIGNALLEELFCFLAFFCASMWFLSEIFLLSSGF